VIKTKRTPNPPVDQKKKKKEKKRQKSEESKQSRKGWLSRLRFPILSSHACRVLLAAILFAYDKSPKL
jgi:hypothetical protein